MGYENKDLVDLMGESDRSRREDSEQPWYHLSPESREEEWVDYYLEGSELLE